MKKRINNDIKISWAILRSGQPEDFTDATNIRVYGIIPNSVKLEVPFTRVLNVFNIAIPSNSLKIGKYDLAIIYQKPDASIIGGYGTHSVNRTSAFEVVRNSIEEDDEGRTITDSVNYAVDGATFTPVITDVGGDIILSWTNDKALPNPTPVILNEGVPEAVLAANGAASTANSAAANADTATGLAGLATIAANAAASNADTKAGLANNAAETANQVAQNLAELEIIIAAAESARVSVESLRVSAEGARVSAEELRVSGESNRGIAEGARVTAEGLRVTAEQARTTAEGLRVTAEQGRSSAEGLRVTAEQSRATAEGLRVTAEQGRATAEGLRVTAEQNRVTAENARVQAEIDRVNSGAALVVDVKAIQPAVAFYKRVTADGGTVVDKSLLAKVYTELNQSLANTHCLYFPQIGIKERVSGINRYANKLYDLSGNNNDAGQATEATQPYIGGYIAPNEFRCLKYLQGQTQTGEVAFTSKSYLATDSWTLIVMLKANKRGTTRILTGAASYIDITATTIVMHNGTSATLTGTHTYDVGKISEIEFQYSNGTGLIKVNNIPLATTVISTTMTFARVAYSSTNPFDGSLYYFELRNERISEAESQANYNFLRSLFPEIEGINSGNQHWQTSNYEATVVGSGEAIPEVQGATSGTELLTLDFNNWTPVGTVVINSASTFSTTGAGGVHKSLLTVGSVYLITFTKDNANCKLYNNAGTGATAEITSGVTFRAVSASIYFLNSETGTTVFSAASVKAAGWADLTTPAWCYYNNDPTLGAVYGKLYNWYAIDLINKYAPQGWRVPSSAEFTQLATYLGGTSVAGGKMKVQGLAYWNTPNTGATNESGFSVIAGGWRRGDVATFTSQQIRSTISSLSPLVTVLLANDNSLTNIANHFGSFPQTGLSLRLIRAFPTVSQRGVIRVSTTANIASTPIQIPIPFGCQVESIRIRNKQAATNLTSVSATHNNTAGSSLGTLITGKTVNAATSSIFVATQLDMISQETDGTVRILATGNAVEGCDIEVTYKVMAL